MRKLLCAIRLPYKLKLNQNRQTVKTLVFEVKEKKKKYNCNCAVCACSEIDFCFKKVNGFIFHLLFITIILFIGYCCWFKRKKSTHFLDVNKPIEKKQNCG